MIEGGFYLKARCIQNVEIAHASPCVREIWDWLLLKAMHTDGDDLKRGQVLTTYDEIREGLSWYAGWRKETYSKWDCERAMKALRKATMIATMKTTRGMVITICNYSYYQDPANYESHKESHRKTTRTPQHPDTIDKNVKNVKNERIKEEKKKEYKPLVFLSEEEYEKLTTKFGHTKADDYIDQLSVKLGSKYIKYDSHYLTILNYERRGYFTEPKGVIGWAKP